MIPLSYNLRNLRVRWKTTLMSASGFLLVAAALMIMLAFVNGVAAVCATSGEPENVIVLSKGSNDEAFLKIDSHAVRQVENVAGVALRTADAPRSSPELFMFVTHFNDQDVEAGIYQVRGVLPSAFDVHTKLEVTEGRKFRSGLGELIVGRGVQRSYALKVGDHLSLGRKSWTVTGIFESGGSTFESEIWCDLGELASQFRREGSYSSVVLRTADASAAGRLVDRLKANRTIRVEAQTEPDYYRKQADETNSLRDAVWVIAWFMGIGAIFGIMNSMFAAIGQRTKDIAVLRVLGFKPHEILISFLLEATLIAAIGGTIGGAIAYAANGMTRSALIGWRHVEFAFHVDSSIIVTVGLLTLALGVLGGLLPALSAMRVEPLKTLS